MLNAVQSPGMKAAAGILLTTLVLTMQTTSKQIVTVGPAPVGPYSPAVKAGGFIYVSGTLAQDSSGAIVGKGDVGAQTRRVIERMRDVLTAAGSSLEQVVAVTVYLTSASDFAAMNDAYRTFWPKDPPTRTTVVAGLVLPDAMVELSMIAVPNGAERAVIHPADWMKSPNPYSYAIKSGNTLFLSGLVSRNGRDNTVVAGDILQQTRTVMDNASQLLKAAGMTFANVVGAKIYLPDTSVFQQMNDAYRSHFTGTAPPARATVRAALAGSQYNVEITMVASSAPREAVSDGRAANPNLSPAIRDAGQHPRDQRRHGRADARDARAHPPHAYRGWIRSRARGRRSRLSHRAGELRRDERCLSLVLWQGVSGPCDGGVGSGRG
jgi:aminoacrylate peracid reductase